MCVTAPGPHLFVSCVWGHAAAHVQDLEDRFQGLLLSFHHVTKLRLSGWVAHAHTGSAISLEELLFLGWCSAAFNRTKSQLCSGRECQIACQMSPGIRLSHPADSWREGVLPPPTGRQPDQGRCWTQITGGVCVKGHHCCLWGWPSSCPQYLFGTGNSSLSQSSSSLPPRPPPSLLPGAHW